jgi:uncharacterized cysteine cluster protein YcgN (CxxCxxCC family)
MGRQAAFWKIRRLDQMTPQEWESLCDGCGWCCLNKLKDPATGRVYYTCVSCYLLDLESCRCRSYQERKQIVPGCLVMTPERAASPWLPPTCAYRLLAEGRPLPWWHPLISGTRRTVHDAGASVLGHALSEELVHPDDLQYFIFADRVGLPPTLQQLPRKSAMD